MKVPRFMVISSFRYALGRKTYIVDETIRWIKNNLNNIERFDLELMVKEIREYKDMKAFKTFNIETNWVLLSDAIKRFLKK